MKEKGFLFCLMLVVILTFGYVGVFAQTPEGFHGTWITKDVNSEGKFIITAETMTLSQNGEQKWSAEIESWKEIVNEGKNKQDYPTCADITLKVGKKTGPFLLFIYRDKKRFVMKGWLGVNWDYPFIKQ